MCYICLLPGTLKCLNCESKDDGLYEAAYFCSEEHLILHRDEGKLGIMI